MHLIIKKSPPLSGSLEIPGSKSQALRALFVAALAKGDSVIHGMPECDDVTDAKRALSSFGVSFIEGKNADGKNTLIVRSSGPPFELKNVDVYSGNSGITAHFLMPFFGLCANASELKTLSLGEQMAKRPIGPLLEALENLGMHSEKESSLLFSGSLLGGETSVEGRSSQYVSALLLALPYAKNDSSLKVLALKERPYVDMTLAWLTEHGIEYEIQREADADVFKIKSGQRFKAFEKKIPADFSSASYFFAASHLTHGDVRLENMDFSDLQPDKALVRLLENWPSEIDADDFPDLVPGLAVVATRAKSATRIINAGHARDKETDRLFSMSESLKKMGAKIQQTEDGLYIEPSVLRGAKLDSFGDHRTLMALAVAGLCADGLTCINRSEAVNKTFPDFVQKMRALGAPMFEVQRLVLMGFKHVGKTSFGKAFAEATFLPFRDLDEMLELESNLSPREFMLQHGEEKFRELERHLLEKSLNDFSGVLALGGGAAIHNSDLLVAESTVHLTADAKQVLAWIEEAGRPANYTQEGDLAEHFYANWAEQIPKMEKIAKYTLQNTGDYNEMTQKLISLL